MISLPRINNRFDRGKWITNFLLLKWCITGLPGFFYSLFIPLLLLTALSLFIVMPGRLAYSQPVQTMIDMAGREVTLQGHARRIIPTFKPVTLCVLALGLQDRLVGIDTHSKHDTLTRAVFPEVHSLTGVGTKSTGINLETVVSLKPDLVILYSQKDGLSLADRLATMGISSLVILPETMEKIKQSMTLIARAAGAPQQAEKSIAAMDKVTALIESRTKGICADEKKRAYFASKQNFFNTASGNMLQDTMFQNAGMINVSHELKGYFQNISPEQFMTWNPDIVFISQGLKSGLQETLTNPVLKQVGAVAEHRVHRFPSTMAPWDFPSPLSILGTLWAACRAYPDRFSDVDLMAQIDAFHADLFGKTLSEMGGRLNDGVEIKE